MLGVCGWIAGGRGGSGHGWVTSVTFYSRLMGVRGWVAGWSRVGRGGSRRAWVAVGSWVAHGFGGRWAVAGGSRVWEVASSCVQLYRSSASPLRVRVRADNRSRRCLARYKAGHTCQDQPQAACCTTADKLVPLCFFPTIRTRVSKRLVSTHVQSAPELMPGPVSVECPRWMDPRS